jgi:hypothetical protein
MIQGHTGAPGYHRQGIIGDGDGQSRFFLYEKVEICQKGSTAGQNDTPVNNIPS